MEKPDYSGWLLSRVKRLEREIDLYRQIVVEGQEVVEPDPYELAVAEILDCYRFNPNFELSPGAMLRLNGVYSAIQDEKDFVKSTA